MNIYMFQTKTMIYATMTISWFLFETCKYSLSGHLETYSRTFAVAVGNLIYVVTEVYTPSILGSCVSGHIYIDSSVNSILESMFGSFLFCLPSLWSQPILLDILIYVIFLGQKSKIWYYDNFCDIILSGKSNIWYELEIIVLG